MQYYIVKKSESRASMGIDGYIISRNRMEAAKDFDEAVKEASHLHENPTGLHRVTVAKQVADAPPT